MSESDAPAPDQTPGSGPAPAPASAPPATGGAAADTPQSAPRRTSASSPTTTSERDPDPLRGSRTSGYWAAVLALAVVLLLLAIFVIQNTAKVKVSFLGWDGHAPLAAALLIAAVAGAVVVASAGALRILQLRRRVRRVRRR